MLKAVAFAIALWCAAFTDAFAAAPVATLVVGTVRDAAGEPVAGAALRAFDATGRFVGGDASANDGTFAIAVTGPPATLRVRCRYCRSLELPLAGTTNVAIVVTRYSALASEVPTSNDVAALPYGRTIDDLTLIPFVLPSQAGTDVSDRGLGGGRGLIVDNGVPLVDLALGTSALEGVPDRYVQSFDPARHDAAFRYGSYGAGGAFSLDRLAAGPFGSVDLGANFSLVAAPQFPDTAPAYGESSDAGILSQRGDLDTVGDFAGGNYRAGVATGSSSALDDGTQTARYFGLAHASYATASRRYRTFLNFSAASIGENDGLALGAVDRASYLDLDARLEHPGPVTFAYGIGLRRETAALFDGPNAPQPAERSSEANGYAEASVGDASGGVTAGLGFDDIATRASLLGTETVSARLALEPSLTGRIPLGGGAYLRLGYSEATSVPTLLQYRVRQLATGQGTNGPPLDRSDLIESALGLDTGERVKVEAIAFREVTAGFDRAQLDGLGASLAWQIAPLVSVRAWSLRDLPTAPGPYAGVNYGGGAFGAAYAQGAYGETERSRQVVWATYANGDGLRFDAIAHRDIGTPTAGIALDGDVYVPFVRVAALDLGSSRRGGVRRYYVGFRTR